MIGETPSQPTKWDIGPVWSGCRPVTAETAGSNPAYPAPSNKWEGSNINLGRPDKMIPMPWFKPRISIPQEERVLV